MLYIRMRKLYLPLLQVECVLSELEKLVEAAPISKCPLHFPQRTEQ